MTNIPGTVRALVLGNIKALLDRAVDANSIPVLEVYLEDLGKAKEQLADAAAGAITDVRLTQGKINQTTTCRTEAQNNLDLVLMDDDPANDETLGVPIQARIQTFDKQLASLREQLAGEEKTAKELSVAAEQLNMKYEEMASSLELLRNIDQSTRGQERAAAAISAASGVAGSDAASRIDSIEARLLRRQGVADARLKRAMGTMSDAVDLGVVKVQALDAIAKRRAELAAQKAGASTPTETAVDK